LKHSIKAVRLAVDKIAIGAGCLFATGWDGNVEPDAFVLRMKPFPNKLHHIGRQPDWFQSQQRFNFLFPRFPHAGNSSRPDR